MSKISALVLSCLLLGVGAPSPANAQSGKTVTLGTALSLNNCNNAVFTGMAVGMCGNQVFAGLVDLDENLQPRPYMAKSWEISDDGLTYVFHLRENLKFHDGHPLTSEDVVFSIELVRQYNSTVGRGVFAAIDQVQAPDNATVKISLKHRSREMLPVLSTVFTPILPKHVYGVGPILTNPANARPIGSGPFRLTDYKADEYWIFERNKDFWQSGQPAADKIIVRNYVDSAALVVALETGEVDGATLIYLSSAEVRRLRKDPNRLVDENGAKNLNQYSYLELNQRKPPFNDARVRRALAHAIDRNFIVQKLQGGLIATALEGPIPAQNKFHSAESVVRYSYDLKEAARLLDEAGLKPNANGIRFKMTLDSLPTLVESMGRVADYLKPQLRRIGIDVERRVSPDTSSWIRLVTNGDYEATMYYSTIYWDPSIGSARVFLCRNRLKGVFGANSSGYCNPEVDKALDAAAIEPDLGKAKKLYGDFQRLVTEDAPFVFTTADSGFMVANRGLVGTPKNGLGNLAPWLDLHHAP